MKTIKVLFLSLTVILLWSTAKAQAPTCNVHCEFVQQLSASSFQFDILIMRTGATAFNYVKGQYALSYNTAIRPNGTDGSWTLSIIASDLPSNKRCSINSFSTSTNGVFYLIAPSDNLDEYLVSDAADVLVARVQATLSVDFEVEQLNFVWRTGLPNPFTKLYYNNSSVSTLVPAGNLNYSCTDCDHVLPVELTSFNVLTQGREVNLSWRTESESNSHIFEIERRKTASSESREWLKIGSVAAAGNSSSAKEYSYTDTKLNSGTYSYRLKIIDNDGTFEYSDVVDADISLPKEYALSQNYPNAFNPTTRIDYQLPYDSKVTIELYSTTGEKVAVLVSKELSAGYYNTEINASALNLASGVYIYRMTAKNLDVQNSETVIINKKLMLMK